MNNSLCFCGEVRSRYPSARDRAGLAERAGPAARRRERMRQQRKREPFWSTFPRIASSDRLKAFERREH